MITYILFRHRQFACLHVVQLILVLVICLPAGQTFAQSRFTVSGTVTDAQTGEHLIGVAVYLQGTTRGTTTNAYGFYSLTLSADSATIVFSYVGYDRVIYRTLLSKNEQLNMRLNTAGELQTVEVIGSRSERIEESTRMSSIEVPIAQIKQVPALLGEVDVLKTLQLLPGVQSGSEGSTGLYVRGGSPDQNLILLDGTPVYNASHLFGFFSVFNADALNHVELIKGGFPARYGGRLSSVLDISMKEGNQNELHGEGTIGLIASKLTLEGPIKKDTASFIVSARRTYIDLLTRPFMKKEDGVGGYYFHDFNAKLNYKLSNRDRLYLSTYTGYDKFYFRYEQKGVYDNEEYLDRDRAGLGWGNITSALRWNRIMNDRLFMNNQFTYSRYQFKISNDMYSRSTSNGVTTEEDFRLRYISNIRDLSYRLDFDFIPSTDHYIRFGSQYILHSFKPGALQYKGTASGEPPSELEIKSGVLAHEVALYAEDDFRVTNRLKINAGVRLTGFLVQGRFYGGPEPRLSARYFITDALALKVSYARMNQYIHLLTNSGIGLPTDLWVPATKNVKPQQADQIALGLARTLGDNKYEISAEGYYKWMRGLIEYQEGASFLGNIDNNWDTKIASGRGWTYGTELFLQKKTGDYSGWIGYTLAWNHRQFDDLNFGEKFPFRYDRRHDISLVVFKDLTRGWKFSGTWVYGTGNAVTLSEVRYNLNGPYDQFEHFSSRNNYRMRAYHRMDLGFSKTKKKRWGEVTNNISIYNVYNRRNPFYIYFDRGYGDQKPSFKQISLFPIIPSFSKTFKF